MVHADDADLICVICVELFPDNRTAFATPKRSYGFDFSTRIFCRSVFPLTVITAT